MRPYFSKICIPSRKESVSLEWNVPIASKIKILPKIVILWATPESSSTAQGTGVGSWNTDSVWEGFPERGQAGPRLILLRDGMESSLQSVAVYNPA